MKAIWYRPEHNKDPKKKEQYEQAITSSRVLIDRLVEILNSIEASTERYEEDISNYTGDWAAKQAYLNGQRRVIHDIKSLFDF